MAAELSSEIEIYSMASFPTLVVSDIQASARWYCEALGFTLVFNAPRTEGEHHSFESIVASASPGFADEGGVP